MTRRQLQSRLITRPQTLPYWEILRQPVDNRVKLLISLDANVVDDSAEGGIRVELISTLAQLFNLINNGERLTLAGYINGLPSSANALIAGNEHDGDCNIQSNGQVTDSVEWALNGPTKMEYIVVERFNEDGVGVMIGVIMPDGYFYPLQ